MTYCEHCVADDPWLFDEHNDTKLYDSQSYIDVDGALSCDNCDEMSAYDAWLWFDAAMEYCPASQLASYVKAYKPSQSRPKGMVPGPFAYRGEL